MVTRKVKINKKKFNYDTKTYIGRVKIVLDRKIYCIIQVSHTIFRHFANNSTYFRLKRAQM